MDFKKLNFSQSNFAILHKVLDDLSESEKVLLDLRFWKNMSLIEIGRHFGWSWDATDLRLRNVMRKLKSECLKQPAFSLSKTNSEEVA